jgi:hypothetical protein
MAPAEGVKFTNDPIPFGKPPQSQPKRSGPLPIQAPKEPVYPPSESIILPEIDSEYIPGSLHLIIGILTQKMNHLRRPQWSSLRGRILLFW